MVPNNQGKKPRLIDIGEIVNFSEEEQLRILKSIHGKNKNGMSVRDFYGEFGIDTQKSIVISQINETFRTRDESSVHALERMLPYRATGEIEEYLGYKIPLEMRAVTNERFQNIRNNLLKEFTRRYNYNPSSLETGMYYLLSGILAASAFVRSLGRGSFAIKDINERCKEVATTRHKLLRKQFEEDMPDIAEVMLIDYFTFEKILVLQASNGGLPDVYGIK